MTVWQSALPLPVYRTHSLPPPRLVYQGQDVLCRWMTSSEHREKVNRAAQANAGIKTPHLNAEFASTKPDSLLSDFEESLLTKVPLDSCLTQYPPPFAIVTFIYST